MNKPLNHGIACLLACALVPPPLALAGITDTPPAASAFPAPAQKIFSQEQLDQMLAAVALYPDALLSQILMASTYPLEVVEAGRWVKEHKALAGAALQDALATQPWDASIKSLCAFPRILNRMSKDIAWTQKLGDAFVEQEQQVMNTVQNLRGKAQAAGTLRSNAQQQVTAADGAISIAPVDPQVLYIPTYDPAAVYGSWWWPEFPPYYPLSWRPPGGSVLTDGFFWGVGIAAGLALWGGFNWARHGVDIDLGRYNRFNRTHLTDNQWHFDPAHRGGVPYRGVSAQQRFAGFDQHAVQAREPFRGRDSSLVPQLHGEALNVGHGGEAGTFASRGYASMDHHFSSGHYDIGMVRGMGSSHFGGGHFGGGHGGGGHGGGGHR